MGMSEEWESILEMGRKDLGALELFENSKELADEIFGFHAQQAAEKALKAWISRLGGEYPPTHDLGKLIPILQRLGVDPTLLWPLTRWTSFAVQFRYDGLPEDSDPLPRREIGSSTFGVGTHLANMEGTATV
jgi:HEPN domain-containing protein